MSKIKVSDYGDVLALKYDGKKLYFSDDGGSYTGQYVAVIEAETELSWRDKKVKQYYVIVDEYGSCSGCDWLEAEIEWDDDYENMLIEPAKALEYGEQTKPLYILAEKPTDEWVKQLARKAND